MKLERKKVSKTNKFGDRYEYEIETLVYEDEDERRYASRYNQEHEDTYSHHCLKQMDQMVHAHMDQVLDAFEEFMNSMDFN